MIKTNMKMLVSRNMKVLLLLLCCTDALAWMPSASPTSTTFHSSVYIHQRLLCPAATATTIQKIKTHLHSSIVNMDTDKDSAGEPIRVPLQQVTQYLHAILLESSLASSSNTTNTIITTTGYITHKRSLGSSLAFIDLTDTNHDHNDLTSSQSSSQSSSSSSSSAPPLTTTSRPGPLQALLKQQAFAPDSSSPSSLSPHFKSISKSLYPGTKVCLEGIASTTNNPGEVVLLVTDVKFLGCSRNPEHIRGMLQRIRLDTADSGIEEGDVNSDGKKDAPFRGLDVRQMEGVFGPLMDMGQLQKVLRGDQSVESFFGLEENDALMLAKKASKQGKIPFSRIAKLIANQLPDDKDYPYIILNSKGASANPAQRRRQEEGGGQIQYRVLSAAPSDVMVVPDSITKQVNLDWNTEKEVPESTVLGLIQEGRNGEEGYSSDGASAGTDVDMAFVQVSGWVQNRRRFQGHANSIAILELVGELSSVDSGTGNNESSDSGSDSNGEAVRLKCALHADCFKARQSGIDKNHDILPTDAYGHLMAKGSKVLLEGYLFTGKDRPTLWVTQARLQRSSWRPATVKYLLDLMAGSKETGKFAFEVEEIADALAMGHSEARSLVKECETMESTERQWRAAEMSRDLQDGSSRLGVFTDDMKAVLVEYKSARDNYPLQHIDREKIVSPTKDLATIPMRRRSAVLRASTEGSRWRGKKRPQLEFMAGQVREVLESHPDFRSRPLNILDVGGGRGHLSNYLSSVLGNDVANVHVIDIDSRAIKNGVTDAKRKGLDNVRFGVGDASSSANVASLLTKAGGGKFDIVVALHACGALSDVALGHAVSNSAGFVITPCCFRSNPFLNVSLPSQESTIEEVLVRPSKWLGMDEESMAALTSAAELQGDIKNAGEAIHTLCALRAQAVKRNWKDKSLDGSSDSALVVQIKSFPIGFSTRNYCIVGTKSVN